MPAPSETRTSKCVPIKSKQNAMADAIGTNQATYIDNGNCDNAQQELLTSPKKASKWKSVLRERGRSKLMCTLFSLHSDHLN
jgi:hypothetical protein